MGLLAEHVLSSHSDSVPKYSPITNVTDAKEHAREIEFCLTVVGFVGKVKLSLCLIITTQRHIQSRNRKYFCIDYT